MYVERTGCLRCGQQGRLLLQSPAAGFVVNRRLHCDRRYYKDLVLRWRRVRLHPDDAWKKEKEKRFVGLSELFSGNSCLVGYLVQVCLKCNAN